jgi:hypothetical protein
MMNARRGGVKEIGTVNWVLIPEINDEWPSIFAASAHPFFGGRLDWPRIATPLNSNTSPDRRRAFDRASP